MGKKRASFAQFLIYGAFGKEKTVPKHAPGQQRAPLLERGPLPSRYTGGPGTVRCALVHAVACCRDGTLSASSRFWNECSRFLCWLLERFREDAVESRRPDLCVWGKENRFAHRVACRDVHEPAASWGKCMWASSLIHRYGRFGAAAVPVALRPLLPTSGAPAAEESLTTCCQLHESPDRWHNFEPARAEIRMRAPYPS